MSRLETAYQLAENGDYAGAKEVLVQLASEQPDARTLAILKNDLGAILALEGDLKGAEELFRESLAIDGRLRLKASQSNQRVLMDRVVKESPPRAKPTSKSKVAILSLLFNWPSTGGGTVHTAELGKFLSQAGYEVKHIYASYPEWGVGRVTAPTGAPTEALRFDRQSWNETGIKDRFKQAVDAFGPDHTIITDSWNTKPLLSEAVEGYPYFLRLAALECLCPLNNVRLLIEPDGRVESCPRQQLATPGTCRACVATRGHYSGSLHQAERTLADFDSPAYPQRLHQAFQNAQGVLVVNPLIGAMVAPFAKAVHVIPSGFDPARFPWPTTARPAGQSNSKRRILFAGLVEEPMKGFFVLQQACSELWKVRQDFELMATADPVGKPNPFTRFIGWLSQSELPRALQDADLLVFPTIAEEALGRSAVEAMGAGIPVIASRIGGLPFTVTDGLTGLLFEPGNSSELAQKIRLLLDDHELRTRLGREGRKRFEADFTWDAIIERHYRALLTKREASATLAKGRSLEGVV